LIVFFPLDFYLGHWLHQPRRRSLFSYDKLFSISRYPSFGYSTRRQTAVFFFSFLSMGRIIGVCYWHGPEKLEHLWAEEPILHLSGQSINSSCVFLHFQFFWRALGHLHHLIILNNIQDIIDD
jgi:hypothetical protein